MIERLQPRGSVRLDMCGISTSQVSTLTLGRCLCAHPLKEDSTRRTFSRRDKRPLLFHPTLLKRRREKLKKEKKNRREKQQSEVRELQAINEVQLCCKLEVR